MDIQPSNAAKPTTQPATDKGEKFDDAAASMKAEGAFSHLLQGLKDRSCMVGDEAQDLESASNLSAGMANIPVLEVSMSDARQQLLPGLNLETLVGQTQRLDAVDADAAVQDGSFLLARQEAGLGGLLRQGPAGAQPRVAVGHSVATVAAGTQPMTVAQPALDADVQTAVATAVLAETADAVDGVVQPEQGSEGRIALQGAWKLEEPGFTPPALLRTMGQIEQWAAASAGVQPKPTERVESRKTGTGEETVEGLTASTSSGTRLAEAAVKEAQATQDAAFQNKAGAPLEDMRFWLQGKQQRAEVLLDKDGLPVRVQVMLRGNEAHVTFRADQAHTRELLDSSLAQLRDMLAQQGVQLAGVSVQADAQGQQSFDNRARNPWGDEGTGQVAVAVETAKHTSTQRTYGLDLYA